VRMIGIDLFDLLFVFIFYLTSWSLHFMYMFLSRPKFGKFLIISHHFIGDFSFFLTWIWFFFFFVQSLLFFFFLGTKKNYIASHDLHRWVTLNHCCCMFPLGNLMPITLRIHANFCLQNTPTVLSNHRFWKFFYLLLFFFLAFFFFFFFFFKNVRKDFFFFFFL
jgi:hypothetical protein